MTYKVNPFRRRESTVSAGGATEEVPSDVVPPNVVRVVQHISVVDEDNDVTQVRILIRGRGFDYIVDEQESLGADDPFVYKHTQYIHEGEFLVAEFTGSTSGDNLRMFYSGFDRVPVKKQTEET